MGLKLFEEMKRRVGEAESAMERAGPEGRYCCGRLGGCVGASNFSTVSAHSSEDFRSLSISK